MDVARAVPDLRADGVPSPRLGTITRWPDDALAALEDEILLNPNAGKVIQGTGGLRKMRFAAPGSQRGKSKSFRFCYVDFTEFGFIFLVTIYTHNEKDNLSPAESSAAADLHRHRS